MSEHPIIFSADMIRTILAGRKTQTRRMIRNPGRLDGLMLTGEEPDWCPYGKPGDTLWPREGLRRSASGLTVYAADGMPVMRDGESLNWKWQRPYLSGRFMPRYAARNLLEIETIRAEQLQDITEDDARAEGTTWTDDYLEWEEYVDSCAPPGSTRSSVRECFADLWDRLNAKRGYPWDGNWWVWVIGFRRRRNEHYRCYYENSRTVLGYRR